ncbi:glycosyltransferase [Chloroflexota bacterium]
MKILQVSATFPPRKFGGVTSVSYNISKALVKLGHDVTVYTTDINDQHSRISDYDSIKRNDGVNVYYFKNISNSLASNRIYTPQGFCTTIKNTLNRFDIIHLHEVRSFQSMAVHHYAKKYNIPYILQAHGSLPRIMGKQLLKYVYDKFWGYSIIKDASKVIALTKYEVKQYKTMGLRGGNIEIVPNGINLAEFINLPKRGLFKRKWNLRDDQKIILFLARINRIKGPDLLAKAFSKISEDNDSVKLIFSGPDDGYLNYLKYLVMELKIEENVLFTGPLYGQDKLEAFIDADVYVLPSIQEAFPTSVLEACACSIPVIVTDRCGIANIINNQAGLVVPYDKNALGKAILNLMNDDKKRQELGERGKLLVRENFNWEKIVKQMEYVYLNCLSPKN